MNSGFVFPADTAASADAGKVSALGACWSTILEGTHPFTVIAVAHLDEESLDREVDFTIAVVAEESGDAVLSGSGRVKTSRKEGVPPTAPVRLLIPLTLPGVKMSEGLHTIRFSIGGDELARYLFHVLPDPEASEEDG